MAMRQLTMRAAINEALREEMQRDPRVIVLGEDIGPYGGARGATRGLWEEFGSERIVQTPISEALIAAMCTGAALAGMRPIGEIFVGDCVSLMVDNIVNHAAKMRYAYSGQASVPYVLRGADGAGFHGGPHQSTFVSWFMSVPGLKVVVPSSPYTAKGLLKAAIRDDDPVLCFEPFGLYDVEGPVPEEDYVLPLGKASVEREGEDLTIIAVGRMVPEARRAAEALAAEGVKAEVVDPRTVRPIDTDAIVGSVRKTGRALTVHEGWVPAGVGAEFQALLAERAFEALRAPLRRLGTRDIPIPASPALASACFPGTREIIQVARELMRASQPSLSTSAKEA